MAPQIRRPSGEILLLGALVAVQLIPIWTLSYFPSQDGPAHLAIANILREYGGPDGKVLREYFVLEPGALTNWFVYILLAHVLRFLPMALAEKAFLSAYVILFPLSVRYAVRAVEPRNAFLALLALPFTYNYLLGMGFYNFCCSLVAFFFALGYWLRHRERLGWRHGTVFALLTLGVYLCHVVSVGTLLAAIGTLAAWTGFRRLVPTVLALMPTLVLMLVFVGRAASETTSIPAKEKLVKLLTGDVLASFDPRTRYLGYAAAVLFGALALWVRKSQWLAVFLVFVALVLVVPSNVGVGGFIELRLSLFPFFALILWLSASDPPAALRQGIQVAAVGLTLALLGVLWTRWRVLDGYLAEYISAEERIPEGSTVLPLSYSHCGTGPDGRELAYRIQPFLHAGSHVAAGKPVADLSLYAANYEGYFPVHYRPALNPYRHIAQRHWVERVPPWVDFLTYPKRTGGRVDFVLLWQMPTGRRYSGHAAVRSLWQQLRTGYERVWVSPRGFTELYRFRKEDKRVRTRGARILPTAR
ncbi:MAG: hypothetical protein QOH06_4063 [Acidobacteriota bacterium]|nr:hypothetical protein [Acidobacteriota bacterium]